MNPETPSVARPVRESQSEMNEIVLPNDTNPLGFLLGGRLMHWIDLPGRWRRIAIHGVMRSQPPSTISISWCRYMLGT